MAMDPASVATNSPPATVNTNDVPVASGTGILDWLSSQSQGAGIAIAQSTWLLIGLGVLGVVVLLLVLHFG